MENKSLGALIKEERIKKGKTQVELGQMIGLKASRVSKIENGAPITPEVASYILEKLGSKLQIKVVDAETYNSKECDFIMSTINFFAKSKSITIDKAYNYLVTFKGLDFLQEYQEIEKTLGYEEICNDLTRVCANNGGML